MQQQSANTKRTRMGAECARWDSGGQIKVQGSKAKVQSASDSCLRCQARAEKLLLPRADRNSRGRLPICGDDRRSKAPVHSGAEDGDGSTVPVEGRVINKLVIE